jgi:hypothetical protein
MKTNEIKIDRLEIRLQGGNQNSARTLGAAIGEEVLQRVAQHVKVGGGVAPDRRSIRIAKIDAGTLRLESSRAAGSGSIIAGQIAGAVSSKIAPATSGGKR